MPALIRTQQLHALVVHVPWEHVTQAMPTAIHSLLMGVKSIQTLIQVTAAVAPLFALMLMRLLHATVAPVLLEVVTLDMTTVITRPLMVVRLTYLVV